LIFSCFTFLLGAMRSHGAIVGFVTQASEAAAYPPFGIAWRTKFFPGSNVRHSLA